MLICILTKNVITSCSVTMMLFLHLEVKPLMTLTTVLYLSCALISDHLAMILIELTRRRPPSTLFPYTTLFRSPFGPSARHRNAPVLAWTSTGPSSLTYNRNVVSDTHCAGCSSASELPVGSCSLARARYRLGATVNGFACRQRTSPAAMFAATRA